MRLSQLEVGETGIVKEFTDLEMSVKLMEMGCLPGIYHCAAVVF